MRKSVLILSLLAFLMLQFAYGGGNRSTATPPHPVVSYSVYLVDSGTGSANAVAMDSSGHIYVAGTTASTDVPLGTSLARFGGKTDVFVSQISGDGSSLLYLSSLLGSATNEARGLAVDSAGNIYIAGTTHSADFPTRNALQPFCSVDASGACSGDAFVAKFDTQGTLLYSTYLGGSGNDVANGIAVDAAGNAYITGTTDSTDFLVVGALQWAASGKGDAFVAKIAADGSHLIYATYLGGSGAEEARGIAVDAVGNVYVTGKTSSPDFPTKAALQANCALNSQNICDEAFVAQISADGSALVYSTYLGGSGADGGNAIAVDASGNAYIVGETLSSDFPLVKPFQGVARGGSKVFVSKLAADGSSLLYSTYLGGSGDDRGYAISVDNVGNAYIAGETLSSDFPLKDAIQAACKKDSTGACTGDAFVAVLDPKGAVLEFSSYFGGSGTDQARWIAVDAQGAVYVAGATTSSDFPFTTLAQLPTSSGGSQATSVSSGNSSKISGGAFVAKITEVSVASSSGTNNTGTNDKKTHATTTANTACSGTTTNWLGGTGNWSSAAMWSTKAVPNGSTANVCIDNGNSTNSVVTLDVNVTVGTLVVDAGDSLTISNGITFIVAGGISNSGQIVMNGSANPTFLEIANGQNVTLTGGGILAMAGPGYSIIAQQSSGGGSTLTNVDNVIQGSGQIGWDGLAVVNQASGTINATPPRE